MRGRALAAAASGAAHHGSDIPVSIAVALACDALHTGAWGGGNVRDGSVRDVWERARPLRYTRDRSIEDLWGYCRSCYYAAECMGGCTWTAHSFFGKPGNNPYCHHRALELARAGLRERVERVQAAPGAPFDHGRFELITEPPPGASSARVAPA